MDDLSKSIKSRIDYLTHQISSLEESISSKPIGHLILTKERGNCRFYQYINSRQKNYLGPDKKKLLAELAQKSYEEKLLKAAVEEKNKLLEFLKSFPLDYQNKVDKSLKDIDPSIGKLIVKRSNPDDEYVRKWMSESYYKARITDSHIHETIDKTLVRSKSEVIIADRLHNAGIPYRYEQALVLGNTIDFRNYYPDFTILNKRTRTIYYWEHLGMLGDESYCCSTLEKLECYAKHGIIQGKNLILTFECKGRPISTRIIDQMIKTFLI